MKTFKTLDDIAPAGKTVLVRADLNVPFKSGKVTDATRIDRLLPTLTELSAKGARVVVLSHFGRPDGKPVPDMSLRPVAEVLGRKLGRAVSFANDCIGASAQDAVANLESGDIAVLENVRFHAEEEKDDVAFARKMAALGDLYVNDAFSTAHRAHATTHALARLLPAYAGRLMEGELNALNAALGGNPKRPVAAIVGGAKISTKLDLLNNLVARVDYLILGGGMANTFLFAQGVDVGASLCERDMADTARTIAATAKNSKCTIVLPTDAVATAEFKAGSASKTVPIGEIPSGMMMLDIGPRSLDAIAGVLKNCRTVLWNGPLGVFEMPPFDAGTNGVAGIIAELTTAGKLLSVAGGGDTVSALVHAGVEGKLSYVSTAGGAFLEWLEGKELPGVAALCQAEAQAAKN